MSSVLRVNDGSSQAPKLEVHMALWGMTGLGEKDREWSLIEKMEKLKQAGFTGILIKIPEKSEEKNWLNLLEQYQFRLGVHSFPRKREDLREDIKRAKDLGAIYINAQVMDSFVIDENAVDLLTNLVEEAGESGIPLCIETHRGRITQDLIRSVQYLEKIPDLRFTIDLSHYAVSGEIRDYTFVEDATKKAEPFFDKLLKRTSTIHARISNGEQIQINIGPNGDHPWTTHYIRWWEKGMQNWLIGAQKGDILPFVCELGPEPYAIIHNDVELSDRWEQSLLLKKIAKDIWESSCKRLL